MRRFAGGLQLHTTDLDDINLDEVDEPNQRVAPPPPPPPPTVTSASSAHPLPTSNVPLSRGPALSVTPASQVTSWSVWMHVPLPFPCLASLPSSVTHFIHWIYSSAICSVKRSEMVLLCHSSECSSQVVLFQLFKNFKLRGFYSPPYVCCTPSTCGYLGQNISVKKTIWTWMFKCMY